MKEKKDNLEKVGSTVIVGGGVGGMQAALDLAESGIKVYLVEKNSAIGGRMPQLDKTFPTNECAMCVVSPKLVECERHLNIEIITNSEIENVEGESGKFEVTLYRKARFVDPEKCTACEDCVSVCPVEVSSGFNSGIGNRKAAYRMYPQAVPATFAIDKKERAACVVTCPAHINAQGYIALISQGKYKEAFELIKHRAPFPGVLGRVCHHPCEGECSRKDVESALAINPLKRFVADFVYKSEKSKLFQKTDTFEGNRRDRPYSFDADITDDLVRQRKGKKVAVVGSGPCGLTAARDLARFGYTVTVFEALSETGGMMRTCIPKYRLPRDILDREIREIESIGVEIKTGSKIESLDKLFDQGFNAIFLALGADKDMKMGIPGEDDPRVLDGISVLESINLGGKADIAGKVAIVGGGNVAIDVARSALRMGAEKVTILYRRTRKEMPAVPEEVEEALKEGVEITFLAVPQKVSVDGDRLEVECIRMKLGELDASGRRRPIPIEGSEFTVEADRLIAAIGQRSDVPEGFGLSLDKRGFIQVDEETLSCSREGVFSGGDVVSGPASVIEAIAAGSEAAISIDRYIRGEDLKHRRRREEKSAPTPDKKVKRAERIKIASIPVKERLSDFREVEVTLSEEEAVEEAGRCLNCGICAECLECEKVCEPCAIVHDMKDERLKIETGAVIITPGVKLFDADDKKEYGYDRYENVITGIQFERILSASGPTEGEVLRPFDCKPPKKIAFIQCVGSRDSSCGNEFCSSVCCMYSIKQAIVAKEHDPQIEATVFYIDIRSFGKDFERYYENAKKEHGVNFLKCMISKVYERPKNKNLMVKYIDEMNRMQEDEFDMVVLAVGLTDTEELKPLAEKLGIKINEDGFALTERSGPGLTSKDGIYVAGTYAEPKDIPETVAEGSSAAALASALLKDARGTMIKKKEYPPEQDVSGEDLRIGVFICRCGRNIAAVVNVPEVVEHASKLKDVAYAGEFLYSCSKDSLDSIKEKVAEHDLNRVVVAACTPRTHEVLFRDTVREAGLNRYLFEMTSIREQVSWVHKDYPEIATQKSKEMVEMMVAKTRRVVSLERELSDVDHEALVVGGGASGMRAALSIAEQGYEVHLVEKEDILGGHLCELFDNLEGEDPQKFLKRLIDEVNANEKIHVMTGASVKTLAGSKGNYTSTIDLKGEEKEIQHGVVVIATGAAPYEPKAKEFGYGESPNVITQVNLEEMLAKKEEDFSHPKTFVMIQCVGSRNDEHPYCSRVCCAHAVKNAIKLKKLNPEHKIIVLYRDIRTYGFMEKYYLQAREAGVVFLRFDTENEPEVSVANNKITVAHTDTLLGEVVAFEPDFLVLSAGITSGDNDELGKTFKVPLNADGFFMEAHAKIKPLDFTVDGIYLCGLAHSPRFLHESLTQALGASVRAVTILSKDKIEAEAITAVVNERLCTGCGLCVSICPFEARELDEETRTARVISTLCQGCGSCAVVCPSGATKHKGFTKRQIMDMIDKTT